MDDRGMTSLNVAKVETDLQKLVIGILYQVHMTYLPAVKMPTGLNYLNKVIEFRAKKIPIVKTTLQNTLDGINKNITDKTALDQYRKTEFLLLVALPTWPLTEVNGQVNGKVAQINGQVAQVRLDLTDKKKLQPRTSSGSEEGSPSKKRSREEVSAQ